MPEDLLLGWPNLENTRYMRAMAYCFEDFTFDPARFELANNGETIALEPQAVALLSFLIDNRNRVVSKDEINEHVWGGRIVSEAALSSRIKILRQALEDDGKQQRLIKTIHGVGFRFVGVLTDGDAQSAIAKPTPASRGAKKPTIAILPFKNLSGDADQEYFSDGVTADIIATLSKHRWLSIIARSTSFGYKGTEGDIRQIGAALGADYIVEGTVQRAGERVRVSAHLIEVISGSPIWADRYDRRFKDIFELQDDVTAMISGRLEPALGMAERQKVMRADRRDLQAWDCYHLGVAHFFRFTADDNVEAQRLLSHARLLDPEFGEAHAWWAYAVILGMIYWDTEPSPDAMEEAFNATCRALEIDDQNAVFYALKARVQLARCEYQSALVENEMAIRLNPTYAAAHCGLADSLAFEGRYDEAIAGFEKAIDLSPNDPQRWAFLTYGAMALIFDRQYERALDWALRAAEIPNCQYWTTAHRAVALALLGRTGEAQKAGRALLNEQPDFSARFVRKKLFYIKQAEQLDLYLEGVRLAGLPE